MPDHSTSKSDQTLKHLLRGDSRERRHFVVEGTTSAHLTKVVEKLVSAMRKASVDPTPANRARVHQIKYRARKAGFAPVVDAIVRTFDASMLSLLAELGDDENLVSTRLAVLISERGLRSADAIGLAWRSTLEACASEKILRRLVSGRGKPGDEKLAASLSATSRHNLLAALALQASSAELPDLKDLARREAEREKQAEESRLRAEERARLWSQTTPAASPREEKPEPITPAPRKGAAFLTGAE